MEEDRSVLTGIQEGVFTLNNKVSVLKELRIATKARKPNKFLVFVDF
jgi:hypothetical protein